MQQGNDRMAQGFYLAQLQACKGSCKCNVCKLLRQSADDMAESMLEGREDGKGGVEAAKAQLEAAGYKIEVPGGREGDR